MKTALHLARVFLLLVATAAAAASLAGCRNVETVDGDIATVLAFPWDAIGKSPASWLTQNLGEVIVGATVALTGGHVVMARRRPKGASQPTRTVRRDPGGRKRP